MDFDPEERHITIRQLVREFAEREVFPGAAQRDQAAEFPQELIGKMGREGITGLLFPKDYHGQGADALSYLIALEELARADLSVALTVEVSCSLAGLPLLRLGTEEQKRRWLVPLASGEIIGSYALTEATAGSDASRLTTRAVRDDSTWVIDGAKAFITNAGTPICGFAIVPCITGERGGRQEVSNIIVPTGSAGYTISKPYNKLGVRASDTRELHFDHCRVPLQNLLGEEGRGLIQFREILDSARVAVAALSVGLAQACLEHSLKRAKERIQFGQPISQFQSIQFRLADMATNVDLARLATYRAGTLMQQGRPFRKEASIAKLFASEAAVKAAEQAVQIFGAYGFLDDSPVARFYRDCKLLTVGLGTSEIQRVVIARELGC